MKQLLMSKHAFIFPGQGSQFPGMGKSLYDQSAEAKALFEAGNELLAFRISDIMFTGTNDDLKETKVTQPAVFLHSIIAFKTLNKVIPGMVAGHSLGEFSALVANGVLNFEEGLFLVSIRAKAMQRACEINPSSMAAIVGLDDYVVENICASISDNNVVTANYNCPGQVVISGTLTGIEKACKLMKVAGAKRALILAVGGAFHSTLMEPAKDELTKAIESTSFKDPLCPIYQNVKGSAVIDSDLIKQNLISQLTAPVQWTQTIRAMILDGGIYFTECGPGKVLQGLVKKINTEVTVESVS